MSSRKIFQDQMGQTIRCNYPPQRIISLVPSQTELLADFGLDEKVVGITNFCVHPEAWRKSKMIVGGTKKFRFEVIDQLQPDLIIGNKEENYREGIERLKAKFPVWMSDITTLKDSLEMIAMLGEITQCEEKAAEIIQYIDQGFKTIKKAKPATVLYMIWRKPWMVAGKNTFIDSMLHTLGLTNIIEDSRYPELSPERIKSLNPEYVFLSSEPYPFREKNLNEVKDIFQCAKILLVDGEMFSWYGSRLMKAPGYFSHLNLR